MKPALILAPLLLALLATPALGASDSREKLQLRRLQQQVQQIEQARALAEQERSEALAGKEALERELAELREREAAAADKLAGERAGREQAEQALAAMTAGRDALAVRLADTEKSLAERDAGLKEASQNLDRSEAAKKLLESELAARGERLRACGESNARLAGLGREMMARYRDKTCMDALKQAEPFTGVRKVEVENLLEAWRDQIDAQTVAAPPPTEVSPGETAPAAIAPAETPLVAPPVSGSDQP